MKTKTLLTLKQFNGKEVQIKALGVWPTFRFNEESEDLALGTTTTTTNGQTFDLIKNFISI